ncbi:unnamed protein product [Peniophora sp. CBMAI 1063]|nr:unnamed protein product [Peniophora sp. CBMAI 1063]
MGSSLGHIRCVLILALSFCSLPVNAFGLSTLNALTTRIFSSANSEVAIADTGARASFEEFEVLKSQGLLTKSDIALLDKYSYRSGCFGLAVSRCDKHVLDEQAQQRAAVSMAVCEIQSASDNIVPAECTYFATENAYDGVPHANCLNALARTDRYWTSYSGYHREITQLCDAYRRSHITELSLDMLQFAMRQQEAALKHANASNAAWREEQLDLMANLSAAQLQALADTQASAQASTELVQRRAEDEIARAVTEHETRLADAAQAVIAQVVSRLSELPDELLSEVTARLGSEILSPLFARTEILGDRLGELDGQLSSAAETGQSLATVAESNLALTRSTHTEHLALAQLTSDLATSLRTGIADFNESMTQAAAQVAHELNVSVARTLEEAREELKFGLGDILRGTALHLLGSAYGVAQPVAVALFLLISPILFAAFVRPTIRMLTFLPRVLQQVLASPRRVSPAPPVSKSTRHVRFELPPARMPVASSRSPAAYRRAVSLPPGV